MNRVVVTGIGLVCPVGLTANESWNNLKKGFSGIAPISHFDASLFPSQIAGEVKNFDPLNFMDAKEVKKSDRFIHLAIASACEAWDQSGLKQGSFDPERAGCIMGVGIGGLEMWEKYHEVLLKDGPRRISPFLIPGMISNLVPGQLAIRFNLKGPNFTITSACASSAHSVGESFKMIQRGLLDIVVTGGSEAAVTPLGVGGFSALRALSTRNNEPEKASRPWDKSRDGFVIAEGAGVLILENYDHAIRRDAKILAEIIGYSCNCDAYHPTAPSENGEGAETCMKSCLKDANISTSSVDYINAHGTSTPLGDMIELEAIKRVFTKDLNRVSISSTKSMTGHLLGAAGALESIVCIMSILDNFVPPTINLEDIEDGAKDCDLVPNVGKFKEVRVALNNSFGFGGTNACIAFKKFDDRSK